MGGERFSHTLSLTSALGGGWWSRKSPGRSHSRRETVPTVHKAGWDLGQFWTGAVQVPPGLDSRPIKLQTIACRTGGYEHKVNFVTAA